MKSAKVVIGAGYGDEGKGLLTDYFSTKDTLVIRYNGSANAGHTVCDSDGRRHVFHHIGAGSFRGAATFLSRFFVCNPLLFNSEYEELEAIGIKPKVYVDPRAIIATPWDMMINQIVEESRGDNRHGSVGYGLHEAMVRSDIAYFFLSFNTFPNERLLKRSQFEWVPQRLAELGIAPSEAWQKRLKSNEIREVFLEQWQEFRKRTVCSLYYSLMDWQGPLVFEGAQGLMLDQDHHFFPYVTHSHTGLTNVDILAKDAGIDCLDVTYVTRSYVTRHGAGPFPGEDPKLSYPDDTNLTGMWQGALRFGHLDTGSLSRTLQKDIFKSARVAEVNLAMTHLDQVGSTEFALSVAVELDVSKLYVSNGPTRNHVSQIPL